MTNICELLRLIKNEAIQELAYIIVNEKLSLTDTQWNLLMVYPDYECSINLTLLQVADYLIGENIITDQGYEE
jgi:hypothetical protein